jgi:hypothetical protein
MLLAIIVGENYVGDQSVVARNDRWQEEEIGAHLSHHPAGDRAKAWVGSVSESERRYDLLLVLVIGEPHV